MKERLMDPEEDSSVTAAIINVVCELGWRRPQDFLPLAPRLFNLLVDGGNNWMAIKIIKLFATLTPLEPRLVKKLLPPLTTLIRTTPAMSVLYECINGIIVGGILEGAEGTSEGEEIASLCVGKLRGMIAVEGDPNLKYVALLAFNKIVGSHAHLVSQHQDIILNCIDNADISIRLCALDLAVCMVDGENLTSIVGRLMRQLRNSPIASTADDPSNDRARFEGVEPAADTDDEDLEEELKVAEARSEQPPPLPVDYRVGVTNRIIEMCSRDTYSNISDFEWYIDILVQLVRLTPAVPMGVEAGVALLDSDAKRGVRPTVDVSEKIGSELQNIAVRVKSVRLSATRAAETLVIGRGLLTHGNGCRHVLGSAVWLVGEYAPSLASPTDTLTALLQSATAMLPADVLAIYLQAILKIYANLVSIDFDTWNPERKVMISLLTARVIHCLEQLVVHPNLEVQERAVEFLELTRLAAEAISGQPTSTENGDVEAPLMLTQAIPSLFNGLELNPVAPTAQLKVPLPDDLLLDTPINLSLPKLLGLSDDQELDEFSSVNSSEFHAFYYERPRLPKAYEPAAKRLEPSAGDSLSYQQRSMNDHPEVEDLAKRRAERREKNKDDPFYIATENSSSGASTPIHNILKSSNGPELDIDLIPIMDLNLQDNESTAPIFDDSSRRSPTTQIRDRPPIAITVDETLPENLASSDVGAGMAGIGEVIKQGSKARNSKPQRSLLQVDSSGIGVFSLEDSNSGSTGDSGHVLQQNEEEEMAKALQEVEKLRLEMQRASERIEAAKGIPPEGTLVKKKKKHKKTKAIIEEGPATETNDQEILDGAEHSSKIPPKKKKKKKLALHDTSGTA
ncbi:MAG: hypothetical protein M1825_004748 [Sarcosagium campestre]|nr:MAG: hypothetical protein M1825_004748 [Sarcosagium campestre]